MRLIALLILPFFGACAHRPPLATVEPAAFPAPPTGPAQADTRIVETRYEIRGYRDATDPSLRHAHHAVFRRTYVPLNSTESGETLSRDTFAPASVAPLPSNEELAAELRTQKEITAQLRALHTTVVDTERKMQAQYSQLVQQTADVLALKASMEAKLHSLSTPPSESKDANNPEPKS